MTGYHVLVELVVHHDLSRAGVPEQEDRLLEVETVGAPGGRVVSGMPTMDVLKSGHKPMSDLGY